jgi:hypothetical protein
MSTVEKFLSEIVPSVIKNIGNGFSYAVIGSRAIFAYLPENIRKTISYENRDWDIMVIGSAKDQLEFSDNIKHELRKLNYKISSDIKQGNINATNLKVNSWIKLYVQIQDNYLHFMDIYLSENITSGTGTFMTQDDIVYNDLGFLFRELIREEKETRKILESAKKLDNDQVNKILSEAGNNLDDVIINLDILDESTDELVHESVVLPRKEFKELYEKYQKILKEAENNIKKVINQRQLLFGAVASGIASKFLTEQVCHVCKTLEREINRYEKLQEQCQSVAKICNKNM